MTSPLATPDQPKVHGEQHHFRAELGPAVFAFYATSRQNRPQLVLDETIEPDREKSSWPRLTLGRRLTPVR